MVVKKIAGKVYGADLNTAERQALQIEIRKEIAAENDANVNEVDAIILYILHTEFGFGEKRLRQFHNQFFQAMKELKERYELPESDNPWLCTKKLLDDGIDIKKWNEEVAK